MSITASCKGQFDGWGFFRVGEFGVGISVVGHVEPLLVQCWFFSVRCLVKRGEKVFGSYGM